jgi:hypothetical protein
MGMDGEEEGGDSLKGLNGERVKLAGEEDGGNSPKGLNGERVKAAAGMHKGKTARQCMGKDKDRAGMDLNLVVVGMHRDCGLGMEMMNRNYPLTNTNFGFFVMILE